MDAMLFALHRYSTAIDERVNSLLQRMLRQEKFVRDARARLAELQCAGHAELIRSSRVFLERMQSVLSRARDDLARAVKH
ncbi:MAG: hypothetical protein K2Y71_15260 [Xanthobacteraceae bacterium]|nr:hypothetical protein [Xanthobacteraceae bacterium]